MRSGFWNGLSVSVHLEALPGHWDGLLTCLLVSRASGGEVQKMIFHTQHYQLGLYTKITNIMLQGNNLGHKQLKLWKQHKAWNPLELCCKCGPLVNFNIMFSFWIVPLDAVNTCWGQLVKVARVKSVDHWTTSYQALGQCGLWTGNTHLPVFGHDLHLIDGVVCWRFLVWW